MKDSQKTKDQLIEELEALRERVADLERLEADRKRSEEEKGPLEGDIQYTQKLQSLGVLVGGIAHDFNNLLVGILGNAGMALMELLPESPVRTYIERIETVALRASELSKQMSSYSGTSKFVAQPLHLHNLVEEMAHLIEVSISKKTVLRYDFAPNLPPIMGDTAQLRQVIMNLITNASEAIDDKSGIIIVSTGAMVADRAYLSKCSLDEDLPEGVYVYLQVSDTGCGMDEETKARIFDPFFTTKSAGRGLGLAAVVGIVKRHNGSISVYTEPARGTSFKILFPCTAHTEGVPAEELVTTQDWRGSGMILVVDDEESVRAVAKMVLEKFGFTVLTASDGYSAVEVFRKHPRDIIAVLLDMTMPHMSGKETFREIRRIRDDTPVILSSGYDEQEATSRFAGKGLAGFIQKPYQPMALIQKVREVLEA